MSRRTLDILGKALLLLMPLIAVGVLEGALRVVGFGYDSGFFVSIEGTNAVMTNDRFGWRYFPPAIARVPASERFEADKPDGTLRVFVLGGSAAMGTPDAAFGLSRQLLAQLRHAYPERDIEVINAAMTAINSHVVLGIAKEARRYEPDLFVVYLGNNEVVGPYGAGTVFSGFLTDRRLVRLSIALRGTRVGQLGHRIATGIASAAKRKPGTWRGMEMFLNQRVAASDPRMARVYEQFRDNVTDVVSAARACGARVVLSTVVTNVRDCPPFASEDFDRDGVDASWKERVERAAAAGDVATGILEGHDTDATAQYVAGRTLLPASPDSARAHLLRARDLDQLRFRADSRINAVIREIAAAEPDVVTLVDAEATFAERAQAGIPGDEALYEHVHFHFAGNHALASDLLDAVAAGLSLPAPADRLELAAARRVLAYNAWSAAHMLDTITATMARPPFTNQIGHESAHEGRRRRLADRLAEGRSTAAMDEAEQLLANALRANPDDLYLNDKLATLYAERDALAPSIDRWRFLLSRTPDKVALLERLGTLLSSAGYHEPAMATFERLLELDSHQADMHYRHGSVLANAGRLSDAAAAFRRALDIAPGEIEVALALGQVLDDDGRPSEAAAVYQELTERTPPSARAYFRLGMLAAERGDVAQAERDASRAIELDPTLHAARLFRANLLEREGLLPEAAAEIESVVHADPSHALAHFQLAVLAERLGDPDRAETLAARALELKADLTACRLYLTGLLNRRGRFERAETEARRLLAREETNARAHHLLGVALEGQGRRAEAAAALGRAVDLDPGLAEARRRLNALLREGP